MSHLCKIRRSLVRPAIVAAIALAFTGSAHANLITDGGFEGDATHHPDNGSYAYGSTAIPAWTVIGRLGYYNVQWLANGAYPYLSAYAGQGFLDMTGNPDYGPAAVQQSFATTVGTAYRVTFQLGYANAAYFGSNGPVGMIVSLGGDFPGTGARTYSAGPGESTVDQPDTIWTPFAYDFTATAASTLLRFEGTFLGDYGTYFIGLDGIDVGLAPVVVPPPVDGPPIQNGVPEPAPLALLGLGVGVGLLARRRAVHATRG